MSQSRAAAVGLRGIAGEDADDLRAELVGQLGQAADVGNLELDRGNLAVAAQGEVGVAGQGGDLDARLLGVRRISPAALSSTSNTERCGRLPINSTAA